MSRIFINGISAKSGGGKTILVNILNVLKAQAGCDFFVVLVPSRDYHAMFSSRHIETVSIGFLSKTIFLPFVNSFFIPLFIKIKKCDAVFNLSDLPIPTEKKQMFLFDWPYAIYPDSISWSIQRSTDYLIRKFKLFFFKRYLPFVDLMIAQTDVVKTRLESLYKCKTVKVISVGGKGSGEVNETDRYFKFSDGYKLLCVSNYYTHKNIEIFIPLAELIKKYQNDIVIVTTVDASQCAGARKFIEEISKRGLQDIIKNLGSVPMSEVGSLFRSVDALLFPTVLETFGLPYLEAMYYEKPILTSDLDFAKIVCGDAAQYFNPRDVYDIYRTITLVRSNPLMASEMIIEGRKILRQMHSWQSATDEYIRLLKEIG